MPSAFAMATTRPDISYTSWMADLPTRQMQIIRHIETHYGKGWFINHMVLTHADNDHATGLVSVLKQTALRTYRWVRSVAVNLGRCCVPHGLRRIAAHPSEVVFDVGIVLHDRVRQFAQLCVEVLLGRSDLADQVQAFGLALHEYVRRGICEDEISAVILVLLDLVAGAALPVEKGPVGWSGRAPRRYVTRTHGRRCQRNSVARKE